MPISKAFVYIKLSFMTSSATKDIIL
jgi:hypothetical protein